MRIPSPLVFLVIGLSVAGLSVPAEEPATTEEGQVDASVPRPIPEEAKKVVNPVPASAAAIENGKLIYTSQCAMCHGATGDGKGELVERFGYTIPDFTDATFAKTTDGEMFYVLTNGHGKMRAQGERLDETTRWNLIHYIRSLGAAN